MCASCTVNNETGFGMTDQVISLQFVMSEVSKEVCLVSIKFKSQLTRENGKEAPKVSKSAIQDSCWQDQRSDWPLMQMSYLVNDWKY